MTETTATEPSSTTSGLNMIDFPECERFTKEHQRQNCRHERLTPEKCDRWRIAHGLAPLDPNNATTVAPAHAIARTGQARVSFGIGKPPARRVDPPLPSLTVRATNFATAAITHLTTGAKRASDDVIAERFAICQTCDKFNAAKQSCAVCGCGCSAKSKLVSKLAWAESECPHADGPKWGAVPAS